MKLKVQAISEKICPLEFAVNTISGKWKIPIIWRINEGASPRVKSTIKGA
jgi:DNA-binding HxlR family transcriptional regulator